MTRVLALLAAAVLGLPVAAAAPAAAATGVLAGGGRSSVSATGAPAAGAPTAGAPAAGAPTAGAPTAGAPAAGAPTAPVAVAALVQAPDGSVTVRRSTASGPAAADVLVSRLRQQSDVVAADIAKPVHAVGAPTPDPLQARQWGLGAVAGPQAWSFGDAAGQVVAVIDSGVDLSHPDLAGALAPGYDVLAGTSGGQDQNGHGTHVAGIIAAVAGNGIGGAGVALRAKVMPIRVLDSAGSGSSSDVAAGIVWAVDHGATVVNLSLGGPSDDQVLDNAIRYSLGKGVPVIAAAGNEGATGNPVEYPAATPGVLSVAAVDSSYAHPAFSNTGSYVGISAPGVDILSTWLGGGYATGSGTSMAAPFISAAAAMVRAGDPQLSPAGVRTALTSTAQDLGAPGQDPTFGAGLVDVRAARASVSSPQPAAASSLPVMVGARSVSSSQYGVLDMLGQAGNGAALQATWNAVSGFGASAALGGVVKGAPSSAPRGGRLDVVARGADDQLWATARGTDGSWEPWTALGGSLTSRPQAAASPDGRVDVVARGADGAVWHRMSTGPGTWSAWESLGGGLLPGTAPAAVWSAAGQLDLVAVGTDHAVWRRTMTAGGWGPWQSLGGSTDSDVAAASSASGSVTVVVRGGDAAAWARTLSGVGDSGWSTLGGQLSAAPGAAGTPGRLDVVVPGTDGTTWVDTLTSTWSGWRPA